MSHGAYVEDLTKLLNAAGDGDTAALDRAWRSIHAEIHEMAERACNAEGTRAQRRAAAARRKQGSRADRGRRGRA